MNKGQSLLIILLTFFIASCSSVYKKHYSNGYTLLKHKSKSKPAFVDTKAGIPQNAINLINEQIIQQKQVEQKQIESKFQTFHKANENGSLKNTKLSFTTSTNKFAIDKIEPLKTDTLYRKQAPNKGQTSSANATQLARTAVLLATISLVAFFLVWILSLIPAIIAIVMARRAESIAKLNGDPVLPDVKSARTIAWVTIGLNLLVFLLILLYVALVILVLGLI